MPPIVGWYVAVASAMMSVSVTLPRGEVPRGAIDSEDGFVHCSGVLAGAGGKDILTVPRLLQVLEGCSPL